MAKNREMWELQQMQALPLKMKIKLTQSRIRQWVNEFGEDGVYISFSGGKDSTVLLDIVRKMYPGIKAVYVDTGLEYPEIKQFVKGFDDVDIIRPDMVFKDVITKHGYPMISKEVSECVQGARKYLTSILEEKDNLQSRAEQSRAEQSRAEQSRAEQSRAEQSRADSINTAIFTIKSQDKENIRKEVIPSEFAEEKHLESTINREKHIFNYECDRVFGTYGNSLEEIAFKIAEKDVHELNVRTAMLIGKYEIGWGKNKLENKSGEKSNRFSQVRYKFFLDAPFEISNKCCNVMKKKPIHAYERVADKKPITAQMASESRLRMQKWLQNGCNAFDAKNPISNPMSFWTEQDVLLYIKENNLPIASVYGFIVEDNVGTGEVQGQLTMSDIQGWEDMDLFDAKRLPLKTTGCSRTGCVFCGFGCHLEKSPNRFERLSITHPKLYDYVMRGGAFDEDGLWKPDSKGLGYWFVLQWINIHGNFNIAIPDYKHYEQKYGTKLTEKYLQKG